MKIQTKIEKDAMRRIVAISLAATEQRAEAKDEDRIGWLVAVPLWGQDGGAGDVIVATVDGEPAGVCLLTPKLPGHAVRIQYLHTFRKHRGKGVARALVEHCRRKHRHLALACRPELKPMYQKMGFCYWDLAEKGSGEVVGAVSKKAFQKRWIITAPHPEILSQAMQLDRQIASLNAGTSGYREAQPYQLDGGEVF